MMHLSAETALEFAALSAGIFPLSAAGLLIVDRDWSASSCPPLLIGCG